MTTTTNSPSFPYTNKKSAQARVRAEAKKGNEYIIVVNGLDFVATPVVFFPDPVAVVEVEVTPVPEPKSSPANWAEIEAAKIKAIEGFDVSKMVLVELPKQFALKYEGKTVCRLAYRAWAEKVQKLVIAA